MDRSVVLLFQAVEAEFRHLSVNWPPPNDGPVSVSIVFDRQPGLPLAVIAQLEDEMLRLLIGKSFSVEWFPCSDRGIVEEFTAAFRGFLSGKAQLVETSKNGRVTKAELVAVDTGKSLASWRSLAWPSFARAQTQAFRVIQAEVP
jgi:hypothetical protein